LLRHRRRTRPSRRTALAADLPPPSLRTLHQQDNNARLQKQLKSAAGAERARAKELEGEKEKLLGRCQALEAQLSDARSAAAAAAAEAEAELLAARQGLRECQQEAAERLAQERQAAEAALAEARRAAAADGEASADDARRREAAMAAALAEAQAGVQQQRAAAAAAEDAARRAVAQLQLRVRILEEQNKVGRAILAVNSRAAQH
jgi:chromosome segregation ATPase